MKAKFYHQELEDCFLPLEKFVAYKIACCDCGLIHFWRLIAKRIKGKTVYGFRIQRDNRATAQYRRHQKFPNRRRAG